MRARVATTVMCCALAPLAGSPLAAQNRTVSLDATVSAGVSSNPFLLNDDPESSAYVESVLAPQWEQADERGSYLAGGFLRTVHYFSGYDDSWSLGAFVRGQRALSPTWDVRGSLELNSSIIGERPGFGFAQPYAPVTGEPVGDPPLTDPPLPLPVGGLVGPSSPELLPPGVFVPDITLLGRRSRQTNYGSSLGASYRLSERSSLSADANFRRYSFGSSLFSSTQYGATLGYSRALSTVTQVGARVSAQYVDYDSGGNSSIYQPQITVSSRLSPRWRIAGGLGLLLLRNDVFGRRESSTGLSADVNLCRDGERTDLCFTANRDASPSAQGVATRRFGVGGNYVYRFNEDDSARVAVDYSRVTSDQLLGLSDRYSYLYASADYQRRFAPRIFGGVTAGYRKSRDAFGGPEDVLASVFIRTRLGSIR